MTGHVSNDERRFDLTIGVAGRLYSVRCNRCGADSGALDRDAAFVWMQIHQETAVASGACK